jgi:S-adenosylmethionine:tRNA ribosyltransferase-isomerase
MHLSDFHFLLPKKLIAQNPLAERDQSNLLVLNRKTGKISDCKFRDILNFLLPGDGLVVNETKVFPARLHGKKEISDAIIEVFLLHELDDSLWEVLVKPARKAQTGDTIILGENITCEVIKTTASGGRVVRFHCKGDLQQIIESYGDVPLPPYIKRPINPEDLERYQTVYAREYGAVAAPTAGLHFTEDLLTEVRTKGVDVIPILLHVGMGTFRPVRVDDISQHKMDPEYYEVSKPSAQAINQVISRGGRIFAVGTTTTRVLETVANPDGSVLSETGWTEKFIFPPYDFKVVNGMITNFHLPGSTLLMMISAFSSLNQIQKAYRHAIRKQYRFYSYGDAMLIL